MANDLISRKALIAEYDRVHIGEPGKARKLIEDAPTVDAVEVVHGRWEYHWFDSYCSECGWENKADSVTRCRSDYPYCPKCGARMDGERKDNES